MLVKLLYVTLAVLFDFAGLQVYLLVTKSKTKVNQVTPFSPSHFYLFCGP